jgi:hypothetical protein
MDFIYLYKMKPLATALSGVETGSRGRYDGADLTNVQYKPIWNCHNKSLLYNEYVLIKRFFKKEGHLIWK